LVTVLSIIKEKITPEKGRRNVKKDHFIGR